jgi:hypothetical protein
MRGRSNVKPPKFLGFGNFDGFCPGRTSRFTQSSDWLRNGPDYVVIMPWNLRAEITKQLEYIQSWGGQFIVSLPRLEVF